MSEQIKMSPKVGASDGHQEKRIHTTYILAPAQKIGNIQLTIIRNRNAKPQSKSFSLIDGSLQSKTNAATYDGAVEILSFTSVADVIIYKDTLGADSSICVGRPKDRSKTRIVTKEKLSKFSDGQKMHITSRSKNDFDFHHSDCLMPLDYDPYGEGTLSKDEFIKCLHDVAPELVGVDLYLSDSTSAHIFNKTTDKELKGAGGYHVYFAVKDGRDIPKIGKLLVCRLWLNGHGFIKITEDGHGICSTLLDDAIWQSTRLMFNQADCGEGLEQRKEPTRCYPSLIGDELLSLADLRPLTDEEITQIDLMKAEMLASSSAILAAKKVAYITKQMNEYFSQNPDVTSEQIDLVRKGYSDARERNTLHPEFIIHFTDGTEASVAAILANHDEYHGKECSDPFEPNYRNGAQVGKLYLLDVNVPFIKSQAHGGYSVDLQSEKERTASMELEFTASLSTIPFEKPDLHKADSRDGTLTTRPLTEKGNAERLYDLHCDKLRFVFDARVWLTWRDDSWLGSDGAAVQSLAAALPTKIYFEAATHQNDQEHFAKWARESQKLRTIKNAVELLSTVEAIRIPLSSLDSDLMKIGFDRARQVIDLRTGKTRKTEPFDYITKSMAPDTVGSASKALRWLQFLNEIFLSDRELINWMQRFCGYVLTGLTQEHFFIFCYGQGANGKSVFIDILKKIMGDYGRVTSSSTFTDKNRKSSDATPELVALVGARLVTSSESEYNAPLAEALTKGLTSGDPMSVRQLQGKTFEFTPRFKTIMFGNHKPVIRGTDNGIWRRVRLIPFDRIFSEDERDPNLFQRFEQEMPHILAWMVEGCIEWQRVGLRDIPQRVKKATDEYKADQDVIGNWLSENATRDMSIDTSNKAYYADYSDWCRSSGYRAISIKNLTTKLKDDHGFVAGGRSSDGRSLRGLKLNAFV